MSAAPSGSGGVLPTRSEVEEWDTSDLANAATGWRSAATASEDLFDQHRQNISSPGGTTWEGDAKDAALSRVTADIGVVGSHGTVLREAAGIAENGVTDINAAKRDVLAAIAETEEDGFSVGEDLSVTDTRESDESTAGARQAAAAEHAEDIRWNAERLVAADAHVGQRLQAKAGELEGIKFEGEGEGRDGEGTIQLVDNKVQDKPPEDAKDKPQPPAEQATGQIGPFAVPKSVEDAAKKSDGKPTVTGDAGGDLGDLLGANGPPRRGSRRTVSRPSRARQRRAACRRCSAMCSRLSDRRNALNRRSPQRRSWIPLVSKSSSPRRDRSCSSRGFRLTRSSSG